MAEAGTLLFQPLMLNIIISLLLFLNINGDVKQVQCSQQKKVFSLQQHNFQWSKLSTSTHSPTSPCLPQKSRRENGAIVLEMRHHDYCFRPSKNSDEEIQNRLILDNNRVRYMQSKLKKPKKSVSGSIQDMSESIPVKSGVSVQTLNYIVTIGLGGKNMTVIVDTGSDLTWIQCQPCTSCYGQQDPLFNPQMSTSYQSVQCKSSTCQSLVSATGFSGTCGFGQQSCNYVVNYGDGSFTRGQLGRERFYLGTTLVDDVVFGCGRNNRGLYGGAAGLMGLGRSNLSLVSQTVKQFGGIFSYCLPATNADSSGSLTLGGDPSAYRNSTQISYTTMISNPEFSNFYFLNLTGISIGGVAVQASGFASGGGILIDSGTVITRLPPSVYNAVKAEFVKQFSAYPSAPPFQILDTCFNLTAYEEVGIPTLTMHFENVVNVNVDVTGMLYIVKTDASQVCLALASLSYEDEVGIIGNFQQKNLRVIYDTKASKVGFAEESCSYT